MGAVIVGPDGETITARKTFNYALRGSCCDPELVAVEPQSPNRIYVLHAERVALCYAGDAATGGTLYVTLEPCVKCAGSGGIPSCSELIAKSGIAKVVIGMKDRNPEIDGRGVELLRNNGVEVCYFPIERFPRIDRMLQSLCHTKSDWRRRDIERLELGIHPRDRNDDLDRTPRRRKVPSNVHAHWRNLLDDVMECE